MSAGDRLASLTERPHFPMVSTYVPRRSSAGESALDGHVPGGPLAPRCDADGGVADAVLQGRQTRPGR
ncbi:hypothetical protein B1H20_02665 [Streptomyces violaceoruber]|uniref:Uncharacterized protein n=1 Tax=Streptomyces violaceoruber TaxID=1935 RepID=A0A1V0U591_STRVN|nr:hypothetical protein B1H20_02665 [Streptomyces violaceoruber]